MGIENGEPESSEGPVGNTTLTRHDIHALLIGCAVVLSLVALVAVWLPAQGAARVEPRIAIQEG